MSRQSRADPIRILMTADTIGGVWTYAIELIRSLQHQGVAFALATMGRPLSREQRKEVERLANVDLFESDYKLEWMEEPWRDVAAAGRWLLEIERRWRPDIIHLNGFAHGALPWRAPLMVVAHSCVFSWFAAVREEHPPAEWAPYYRHVQHGLESARHVTAPTRAMLTALRQHYGTDVMCGGPIPNGRNASDFLPCKKHSYIFTAGRLWDEAKNIALLERVAGSLPWPVFAAGDCSHPDGGTVRPTALRTLGTLSPEDIRDWLGSAAIYALPARYEPFGLSALEAALSGCALVLSDIPSLRENWLDAALFAPPNDPEQWLATLSQLIEDRSLRDRMAAASRQRALSLTAHRMGSAYLKLYRSLAMRGEDYEDRPVLPFTPVGLEPRKRPFPARLRHRTGAART